jgi:hypothetical protein
MKAKVRNRTAEHKKKTMKTTTKNSLKAQNRTEQSSTGQTPAVETVATPAPAPTPNPVALPRISIEQRRRNRALPTESVLNLLRAEAPRFWEVAEVVGKWVWIRFEDKQPREITAALSELGFHWNTARQAWQHPCGTIAARTPRDPRAKYGSYFPADVKTA